MIEVYQNGKLKLRIEEIGGTVSTDDIIILPKRIANNCIMTAGSFDELFYTILQENFPHAAGLTHEQAYNRAEKLHEQYLGKKRYENFESFRASRDQRIKKSR